MTGFGWVRRMSLRRRLIAGMLALVALGLVAFGETTYWSLQSVLIQRSATAITATTQAAATTITATLARSPDTGADQVAETLRPLLSEGELMVWLPDGGSPVAAVNPPLPEGRQRLVRVVTEETVRWTADNAVTDLRPESPGGWRIDNNDYQTAVIRVPHGVVVGLASLGDVDKTLTSLLVALTVAGGVLLVVLAGLGVLIVRGGLRPLDVIARTAAAITEGDRGKRIPVPAAATEVGRVSAALNQMLDETEASFAAQQASEQRLRQFVADASHELRTPLASVRGYAELLRSGAAGTEAQRAMAMNRIESEAARMSELVDDLLLLARLDMGRPLRAEPVDLAALVRDAVADENAIDADRPRRVVIAGDTMVRGDTSRLRQVLVNLLANARVHTPPGTPVDIELAGAPDTVAVVVADHGPGLPPDQAVHVFERFFRADTVRAHRTGGGSGVGLGLSIVDAIVDAHGGSVRVEGRPGEGARFTVLLPRDGRRHSPVLRAVSGSSHRIPSM